MTCIGILLGGFILSTYVFVVIYTIETMREIRRIEEWLKKEKVRSP